MESYGVNYLRTNSEEFGSQQRIWITVRSRGTLRPLKHEQLNRANRRGKKRGLMESGLERFRNCHHDG